MVSSTKTKLRIGFTSVLGLMVLLTSAALMLHAASIKRTEGIVLNQNTKTDLIIRLRTAARERTVSLQKMLIMTDPFDQDEEWMRFNQHGADFVRARSIFLKLEITPQEQDLLDRQAELVNVIGPLQKKIAELILQGDISRSHDMLLQVALPIQDQTFEILSELFNLQVTAASDAVTAAHSDFRTALGITLLVAFGVTLVGIVIARYFIHQITKSESRLHESKERAQITLHSIGDAVLATDVTGNVEQMNAAAEELTQVTVRAALGKPLAELLPICNESNPFYITDPISRVIETRDVVLSEDDSVFGRSDGKKFALEFTAAPIFDNSREFTGVILVVRDVTEMRSLAKQLTFQAHHDALTGLANRFHFEARLRETLAEARRYKDDTYWLCYIDLDQFKVVNDTCGHLAGDELLKQVSDNFKSQLRESDLLARMGGDEFTILLKRCDSEEAKSIVERLCSSVQKMRFSWEGKFYTVTASIGLVPITEKSGGHYDLMRAADTACYIAKDEGRNRVHIYTRDDTATVQREGELQWVHRINSAIEENRFALYFQPIQDLTTTDNELHGEILLRMLDESGEIIMPGTFIPAAERYNLMSSIDRWVIKATLTYLAEFRDQLEPKRCLVSINLSAQSLCEDSVLPFVLEQFDRTKLDPRLICFEITETAAIANLSRANLFITRLKDKGCSFSLDDFGSGLSSFAYLKNMPVDYLKIDGAFVRDIESDVMDHALVNSINQMGHIMGIKTIAEFVENKRIFNMLNEIGVDYGQGYGIARPGLLSEALPIRNSSFRTQLKNN